MITSRHYHKATLLNDGAVLITGGSHLDSLSCCTPQGGAELYRPYATTRPFVLFSLDGGAQRQGAILHAGTNRVVSPSDPAVSGEALEIYGAGLLDGSVIPPQVSVGGRMAEILNFGNAPAFAGVNQINVRVPAGAKAGSDVSVRMSYLGRQTNDVTITIR